MEYGTDPSGQLPSALQARLQVAEDHITGKVVHTQKIGVILTVVGALVGGVGGSALTIGTYIERQSTNKQNIEVNSQAIHELTTKQAVADTERAVMREQIKQIQQITGQGFGGDASYVLSKPDIAEIDALPGAIAGGVYR